MISFKLLNKFLTHQANTFTIASLLSTLQKKVIRLKLKNNNASSKLSQFIFPRRLARNKKCHFLKLRQYLLQFSSPYKVKCLSRYRQSMINHWIIVCQTILFRCTTIYASKQTFTMAPMIFMELRKFVLESQKRRMWLRCIAKVKF